ncbi:hypothetical protein H4S01_003007 [Coemansia sp. RSA 2610]|nr:hypothetical protein H4S01_003007 [Coemansia sp. RSA 2610]
MDDETKIPYNVIDQILREVAGPPSTTLAKWKQQVALLGVCSLWTKILFPVVYSRAFVDYAMEWKRFDSQHLFVTSNIPYIAARNCSKSVKKMSIRTFEASINVSINERITELLQLDSLDWSSVKSLYVCCERQAARVHELESDDILNSFGNIAEGITKAISNVSELDIFDYSRHMFMSKMAQILVNEYAPGLQHLHALPVPQPLDVHFTAELTYLGIGYNPSVENFRLPAVCAKSLKSLKMTRIPETFSWRFLEASLAGSKVSFPCLTTLIIGFQGKASAAATTTTTSSNSKSVATTSTGDEPGRRAYSLLLCFPSLQTLEVNGCLAGNDIAHADFGNQQLGKVSLRGNISQIKAFATTSMKSRLLNIRADAPTETETRAYFDAANSIFGSPNGHSVRSFELSIDAKYLDVDRVDWPRLNRLSITARLPLDKIVQLFIRLPQLLELDIGCIHYSEALATPSTAVQLVWQVCEASTADLSVRRLSVRWFHEKVSTATAAAIVCALIAETSMLGCLLVPADIREKVVEFVASGTQRLPHLANIRLQ